MIMGMTEGRIPMYIEEGRALDKLIEEYGLPLSVSRRDPGEKGPLLVKFEDRGDWVVEDGEARPVTEDG